VHRDNSPGEELSFDNTEIAFRSKSNAELTRSYFLFKIIGINWFVNVGPSIVNFAFRAYLPVKGLIRATVFNQFCGGETMHECDRVMKHLWHYHVGSILDYSVEGKEEDTEFDHTAEETVQTVLKAQGNPAIPFSVFKVTGLARMDLLEKVSYRHKLTPDEHAEWERVKQRIDRICKAAYTHDVRIFIDAEESWIQQAIDDLASAMMEKYNTRRAIVYNTIQFYRHDRLAFLHASLSAAKLGGYHLGIKLVRGAYMEKERARAQEKGYADPIQPDKSSTDRHYNEGLLFCLDHLEDMAICAGTHNEESSMLLVNEMKRRGIAADDERIFFSQLYGMSDHISFNVADKGYNVAKYLPYGPVKSVLPYLFRRAAENTSVKGQAGRELTLVSRELSRRRKSKR
jgi:proline dehydrogenase